MQGLYADQGWQPTELERDALQKLREGLGTARGGPLRAFTSVRDVFKDGHSDAPQGELHSDCPPGTDQAHHTYLTKAGSRDFQISRCNQGCLHCGGQVERQKAWMLC